MKLLKYTLFGLTLFPLGLCGATPSPAQERNYGNQTTAYIQHHYEMTVQRRPYSKKVCDENGEKCQRESSYKDDKGSVYTHSTVTFWDEEAQRHVTVEYQR